MKTESSRPPKTVRAAKKRLRAAMQTLECRQLLSGVSSYSIPTTDAADWDGSSAHVAQAADGTIWFTDATDNAIGHLSSAGTVTLYDLPASDTPQTPADLLLGPDGNLWFVESDSSAIGRITPGGTITEFPTPSSDASPSGLVLGADGNLWFAETDNDAIASITTAGKIREYDLSGSNVQDVNAISAGADGNIWFAGDDNNDDAIIGSISPKGHITTQAVSDDVYAMALGADGSIYGGTDSGTILKIAPDGSSTTLTIPDGDDAGEISAGANGTMWAALSDSGGIAQISSSGVVTEYSVSATASVDAVMQAADGSLWFVDGNTPQLDRLDLDSALLAYGNSNVSATAGSTSSATFGSFYDFAGNADASDYSATVTLENGNTLDGVITADNSGGFIVSASSEWALRQGSSFTLTVTDTRDTSRIATASGYFSVDAPAATGTGVDISTTAAQTFSGVVASFSGVALNSLSSYSASIDWGDGHITTGTITANNNGSFDVSGSNAYAAQGSYTVTTTLWPYAYSGVVYPLAGGGGVVAGVPNNGSGGNPPTSVVTSTNSAGGTSNSGSTTPVKSTPGAIISPISGNGYATASSTATVSAGIMDGTGYTIQAPEFTTPFSGEVATFALADPSYDLSHLHASVQWNDPGVQSWFSASTPNSTGTLTSDGAGNLTVSAGATFTADGFYNFIVTITDDRLPSAQDTVGLAYGRIVVGRPIFWLPILEKTPGATAAAPTGIVNTAGKSTTANPVLSEKVKAVGDRVKSTANQTFAGTVASLHGVISAAKLADLHGTIQWGDGSSSPAIFVQHKGAVAVLGAHLYDSAGEHAVTVTLSQSLYSDGVASALEPLHLPTVTTTAKITTSRKTTALINQPPIYASEMTVRGTIVSTPLSGTSSATRTATITWGDGSTSAATVNITDDVLSVDGSHTYRHSGIYSVSVTIKTVQKGKGGGRSVTLARIVAVV